jgi:hypothetical protein
VLPAIFRGARWTSSNKNKRVDKTQRKIDRRQEEELRHSGIETNMSIFEGPGGRWPSWLALSLHVSVN